RQQATGFRPYLQSRRRRRPAVRLCRFQVRSPTTGPAGPARLSRCPEPDRRDQNRRRHVDGGSARLHGPRQE
ncbi:hypothetical protein LTR94_038333, partial [Friedmanniomyces endolithicus]